MMINIVDDKWGIQLKKGLYEIVILSLLKSKPAYGYEISKSLKEIPGMAISEGAIYPILKRMSKNGWITFYWDESLEGPRRKYYEVTTEGVTLLESRLEQYKSMYEILLSINKD